MFYVVLFHDSNNLAKRAWVRELKEVVKFLEEGFTVYRTGTDQIAILKDGEIFWQDAEQVKP